MKKLLFTTIIILLFVFGAKAQDYNTGVGLRGGLSYGLTVKHFINDNDAIEGILASRWQGVNIIGLYERHQLAFAIGRLNWYYGCGGHVGFWNGSHVAWASDNNNYTVIGVDGIIGLEYNFVEVPINIGVDWKPSFNFVGLSGFWGDGGAISIRYIF